MRVFSLFYEDRVAGRVGFEPAIHILMLNRNHIDFNTLVLRMVVSGGEQTLAALKTNGRIACLVAIFSRGLSVWLLAHLGMVEDNQTVSLAFQK
jgi:hypothetical protein